MKRLVIAAALAAATLSPAFAGTNVGVSIGINQPGVYGRIDIGNMPPPVVVYSQPIIVAPSPVAVYQQPIYLYVPAVQQGNWGRYCGRYGACGQPVYFVRDSWVREHYEGGRDYRYAPQYQGRGGEHGHRGGDEGDRGGDHGNRGGGHGKHGGDNGKHGGGDHDD
jgi:hypothetical protein